MLLWGLSTTNFPLCHSNMCPEGAIIKFCTCFHHKLAHRTLCCFSLLSKRSSTQDLYHGLLFEFMLKLSVVSLKSVIVHCVIGEVSVCLGKTAHKAWFQNPVQSLCTSLHHYKNVGIHHLLTHRRNQGHR